MQDGLDSFYQELAAHGFDLSAAGDPSTLPHELQQALRSVFPGWGGDAPHSDQLLLTGNTRALWKPLLEAAPSLPAGDPLDTYTERVHRAAAQRWLPGARLWFSHQVQPALPFPRIAASLGLCVVGPAQLAVHPEYGPWFGLRALILLPHGNTLRTPAADCADRAPRLSPNPCEGCAAPCVAAFDAALAASRHETSGRDMIRHHFEAWLAVRDACPVGRGYRYAGEQVRFHYGVSSLPRSGVRSE